MANPFFTIGHSTRSVAELADLLRSAEVRRVVDVRTIPRSRTNPQFNRDALPDSLAAFQIGYEHLASLGGLRGRRAGSDPSPNTFWTNESFRNYADYAMSAAFGLGLERLQEIGRGERCAIMCAEAVWWRCHRRIIADYLIASSADVFHILGPGNVEPAKLTPGAQRRPDGTIVYPADQLGLL